MPASSSKRKGYEKADVQKYLKANPLFEDALVNCVRSHPSIWDPEDQEYQKVRCHREVLFESVVSELAEEGYDVSVDFVKNHWEYLRAYYARKRKPIPSGSAAAKAKVARQWPLFLALDFLWDVTGGTNKHADSFGYDGVNDPPPPEQRDAGENDYDDDDAQSSPEEPPSGTMDREDGTEPVDGGRNSSNNNPTSVPSRQQSRNADDEAGTPGASGAAAVVRKRSSSANSSSRKRPKEEGKLLSLPAILDTLNSLKAVPRSDANEATGHYVAAELRALRSPGTADWMIKCVHDLFYLLKTAERRGGCVNDVKRAVQSAISDAAYLLPDRNEENE